MLFLDTVQNNQKEAQCTFLIQMRLSTNTFSYTYVYVLYNINDVAHLKLCTTTDSMMGTDRKNLTHFRWKGHFLAFCRTVVIHL